ncbi:hypothetical protein [Streptomyces sp. enrichment culture]|uniref:hypothetical protein n=1 Tax=Streptomyces sp. enrichment culture TaxID=1795815 RepID=UPI003F55483A
MDLSAIAALLALASIPATLVVARWQKRTALDQAAAAHNTAMHVAEAAHRSALAAAEKAHDHALELLARQSRLEADQWVRDKRHAAYTRYQNALSQVRAAGAAEPRDMDEINKALRELHVSYHEARMVANRRVADHIYRTDDRARNLLRHRRTGTVADFTREWSLFVAPQRAQLDEAIREGIALDAEIRAELRDG